MITRRAGVQDILRGVRAWLEIGHLHILSAGLSTAISTSEAAPTILPLVSTSHGTSFFTDLNDHIIYEEHNYRSPQVQSIGFFQFLNSSNQARELTVALQTSIDEGQTWTSQEPFEGSIQPLTGVDRDGFHTVTMNFARELDLFPMGTMVRWVAFADDVGVSLRTVDIKWASLALCSLKGSV